MARAGGAAWLAGGADRGPPLPGPVAADLRGAGDDGADHAVPGEDAPGTEGTAPPRGVVGLARRDLPDGTGGPGGMAPRPAALRPARVADTQARACGARHRTTVQPACERGTGGRHHLRCPGREGHPPWWRGTPHALVEAWLREDPAVAPTHSEDRRPGETPPAPPGIVW